MFGIDMNPSSGETGATDALTGFSGFAGTEGEGLLSNDSQLINSLLSGNEALTSKLLAPQISQISKNANEKTQTAAQFGTRSGGTNASNQNTMDEARGSVNDLISKLTSGAIGTAGSLGSNLLGMGMSGENDVFSQNKQEQQQRAAMWNDLIDSIGKTAGAVSGMLPPTSAFGKDLSSFGSEFGG